MIYEGQEGATLTDPNELDFTCETERRMNFKQTLAKCAELGLGEAFTRQTLWDEAYQLGRSRWYWGPSWMVKLQGWLNTRAHALSHQMIENRDEDP